MTQHSFREQAIAGGLHAHSVGSAYPFHPVYIATGDEGYWEVHNLMTGKVLHAQYGKVVLNANDAVNVASHYARGGENVWWWFA